MPGHQRLTAMEAERDGTGAAGREEEGGDEGEQEDHTHTHTLLSVVR